MTGLAGNQMYQKCGGLCKKWYICNIY